MSKLVMNLRSSNDPYHVFIKLKEGFVEFRPDRGQDPTYDVLDGKPRRLSLYHDGNTLEVELSLSKTDPPGGIIPPIGIGMCINFDCIVIPCNESQTLVCNGGNCRCEPPAIAPERK